MRLAPARRRDLRHQRAGGRGASRTLGIDADASAARLHPAAGTASIPSASGTSTSPSSAARPTAASDPRSRQAPALARHRCELVISDNDSPNPATSASFVAGEDKWSLLGRSKLLLNVHRDDHSPYFEWVRVLEAIHCGAVVVSERSTAFRPARSRASTSSPADAENLVALAEQLLARRRAPAAHAALGATTSSASGCRCATPPPCSRRGRRAAAPARAARRRLRAGCPARDADAAGAVAARGARRRSWRPPTRRRRACPRWSSRRGSTRSGSAAPDRRARARDRRRGAARGRARGTEPGPGNRPAPRVSVIVPVYNHGRATFATALDSVARSAYRDFELIVVDDGSTDLGGDVAEAWMRGHDHRIPALLLRHPINRGLPATRNTAIDARRGEFVLPLDSDNELFPSCLERLVAALDADPGAAFAYGILQGVGPRRPGAGHRVLRLGARPARRRQLHRRAGPDPPVGARAGRAAIRPSRACTAGRTTTSGARSPSGACARPTCASSSPATGSTQQLDDPVHRASRPTTRTSGPHELSSATRKHRSRRRHRMSADPGDLRDRAMADVARGAGRARGRARAGQARARARDRDRRGRQPLADRRPQRGGPLDRPRPLHRRPSPTRRAPRRRQPPRCCPSCSSASPPRAAPSTSSSSTATTRARACARICVDLLASPAIGAP